MVSSSSESLDRWTAISRRRPRTGLLREGEADIMVKVLRNTG
jgi:hypothetical protein